MLGKSEGRRRGWQRMKHLDGIKDSMGMSLSKFREMVEGRKAWCGIVYGVTELDTTEWLNNNNNTIWIISIRLKIINDQHPEILQWLCSHHCAPTIATSLVSNHTDLVFSCFQMKSSNLSSFIFGFFYSNVWGSSLLLHISVTCPCFHCYIVFQFETILCLINLRRY